MIDERSVRWFSELALSDAAVAGGKGANLGELTRAGLRVPPGFVITTGAYLTSMHQGGLRELLAEAMRVAPIDDPVALAELADSLGRQIRDLAIPAGIAAEILDAYRELGAPAVAVRSSETCEDARGSSFAGMNETFTNVQGEAELISCIKDCWASAYGARVIAYRAGRIVDEPVMAVVIQTMVESERSGVMFSADPTTGDRHHIVVEAAFGLGEVVGGGQVLPDTYRLDSRGPRLLEIRIGYQDHKIVRGVDGGDVRVDLPIDEATCRVLDDSEALALARLAVQVQRHYGSPQDVEWAIQDDVIYLLQSRPICVAGPATAPASALARVHGVLVAGIGACAGTASGVVRVLDTPEQAGKFCDGEILVAPTTSPEWMPILRRAAALVTDGGGITCHAAIISRELGIPSVVGTRTATHVLHDGQRVTVDGRRGLIEEGHLGNEPLHAVH